MLVIMKVVLVLTFSKDKKGGEVFGGTNFTIGTSSHS